ncbi:hypothetical protein C4E24_06425 [ANME-1 cluster archaeon AG-394-G21]|nr:hypothetical protein [ANME-1 cluster archaeon AG-394-G21]NAT10446.1 hypothetical protein [ANME-1 cluster archaeon AG-394-G06]
MVEKFNERANAIANEYWRLKEVTADITDEARLAEIEKLLEKGIGGKLQEQLAAEAKTLRKEKEDRSSASEKLEELKKEITELTADLAPNLDLFVDDFFPYDSEHEPISEAYFMAITDIFFGSPQPSIKFKIAAFSTDGIKVNSTDENSPLTILGYVIMMIQETAKHMLGMENIIARCCKLLKQNEYAFIALGTLIKEGKVLMLKEIKEISKREDREYKELVSSTYDKELSNGVAYLVSDEWEYNMVKELSGEYEVTDFGEWVWRVCNVEAGRGGWKGKGKSISSPNLDIHKIINFLRR